MALTGKQIRTLRGLAHHLDPIVYVGKADITETLVKQTDEALEAHELIKVGVQDTSDLETREAADQLAAQTNSEVVQVIGHRFALYRLSNKKGLRHIQLG